MSGWRIEGISQLDYNLNWTNPASPFLTKKVIPSTVISNEGANERDDSIIEESFIARRLRPLADERYVIAIPRL